MKATSSSKLIFELIHISEIYHAISFDIIQLKNNLYPRKTGVLFSTFSAEDLPWLQKKCLLGSGTQGTKDSNKL